MKSILLVDTPKSCSECDFKFGNLDYRKKCYCLRTGEEVQNYMKQERHPQCPLQDTTELLEALEEDIFELDDSFIYRTDETLKEIVVDLKKLYKALGGIYD